MATTTSNYFPLATETYYPGGAGDASSPGGHVDNDAGASGDSPGAVGLSPNAMIAIIVVVSIVGALGIGMAVLFYIAKKREWKIRETMRKSARKVVTALTPRRTEFPRSVKESNSPPRSHRGRTRLDDVPPTPRLRPEDLEKGLAQAESKRKLMKWGRK
ncbi:uncharacterized protein CTRU02_204554 [Colletotrichum truncatum]|uniref:Uncharacterized protein n=1 Tax=Colletotrichum truncatum TaxID=5467 RepID=A0ACC3ZCN2_COLTU|nr:uncharacterized protein CTRU02_02784 [Colletotrichum truncatum]KAF6797741.1 hypothetical protein CTRU02_02784 [Colletotrichum truncatum]